MVKIRHVNQIRFVRAEKSYMAKYRFVLFEFGRNDEFWRIYKVEGRVIVISFATYDIFPIPSQTFHFYYPLSKCKFQLATL